VGGWVGRWVGASGSMGGCLGGSVGGLQATAYQQTVAGGLRCVSMLHGTWLGVATSRMCVGGWSQAGTTGSSGTQEQLRLLLLMVLPGPLPQQTLCVVQLDVHVGLSTWATCAAWRAIGLINLCVFVCVCCLQVPRHWATPLRP
jgi:hypothetical protein